MKSPLLSLGLVSFLLPAHLVGAVGSDYNLSNGRAKARDPLPLYYDEPSEPYYDAPPPPYYYDSSTKSIATSMSGYYIPLSEAETTTVMWTASSASLFSPASSLADSSAREATFITTSVANGAGTSSSNEAVQTSMGTWQAQEPAEASDGQPDTGPSTSPAKTVVLSPTMDTWSWIAVTTAMSSLALPVPPQVPTSASVPYSSVKVNETLVPISSLSQRPTEHGSKTLLSPLPSITSWMSTSQQSAPPESLFSSVLPVSLVSTSEIVDSDTLTAPSSGSDALGSTKGQPWSISTSSVLTVTYTSTVSQRASTSWRPVPDSPQQPEGPVVSTMSSSAITGGVGTVPSGPFSSGQPASLTSVSLDSSHGSPSETSSLVFASQSAWNKTTVSHSTLPFTYTSPVPPATLSTNSTAPSGKTSLAKETGSFGGSGLPASWTGAHSGMSSLVAETSSISAPYPNSTSAWWITATITSSIWPTGSSASGTTSLNGRHSTVTTTGAPVVNSANSTRLESRMSTASSLALGTESARGPFVTGSPPFPSGRNTTGNGPQALSSAWASTMTWSPRVPDASESRVQSSLELWSSAYGYSTAWPVSTPASLTSAPWFTWSQTGAGSMATEASTRRLDKCTEHGYSVSREASTELSSHVASCTLMMMEPTTLVKCRGTRPTTETTTWMEKSGRCKQSACHTSASTREKATWTGEASRGGGRMARDSNWPWRAKWPVHRHEAMPQVDDDMVQPQGVVLRRSPCDKEAGCNWFAKAGEKLKALLW